jgi:hypothetical protein
MALRAYQIGPVDSIEDRIFRWLDQLSRIQHMRDEKLGVINNFEPEPLNNFLRDIKDNQECQAFGVEFTYLHERLEGKAMTDPLPEQELLGKRTFVLKIGFLVPGVTVE